MPDGQGTVPVSCPAPQLVLVPRYSSMEMFIAGDAAALGRRETFERYRCAQHAWAVGQALAAEACAGLLTSMSAILHGGALRKSPAPHPLLGARPVPTLMPLCARSLPLRPPGLAELRVRPPGRAVHLQGQRHGAPLPPLHPGHLRLRAQWMPP